MLALNGRLAVTAIAAALKEFYLLSRFDCSGNQLKELPSSLGKCSDLSDFKMDLIYMSLCKRFSVNYNFPYDCIMDHAYRTQCIKKFAEWNFISPTFNIGLQFPRGIIYWVNSQPWTNTLYALTGELGMLSKLGTLDLHSNQRIG
ncbi:hypothetical protein Q3G72_020047 [Acer saccharum]|nr:hypothetical protein Q3G72_020047 [Acer saccharum]